MTPFKGYWILWNHYLDENQWVPKRVWSLAGWAKRGPEERDTASVYLLLDSWQDQANKGELDKYFLIDDTGLLSTEMVSAIGELVWPQEEDKKRK